MDETTKGYNPTGNNKEIWDKAQAVFAEDNSTLTILGKPVMESWEWPFMQKLADIATTNAGRVLEVGFGLGISASYVQKNRIKEHFIIEANREVFKHLQEFADQAKHTVVPLFGLWEEVISILPDEHFDGILYDTYPLTEEDLHTHQFTFIEQARRLLKPNGVLTYCNITSWGNLKSQYPDDKVLFEKTQVPYLTSSGYSNLQMEVVHVNPTAECQYYQDKTILAPIVKK